MKMNLFCLFFTVVLVFAGCGDEGGDGLDTVYDYKFNNSNFAVDDGVTDNNPSGATITGNVKASSGNYQHEFWSNGTSGTSGTMRLGNGGTFSIQWNGANSAGNGNVLARRGIKYPSGLKHTNIGIISVNYAATLSPSQERGVSYLCVYGWFQNPLVEYYIIDDWGPGQSRPPRHWENATQKGSIDVDGGTYNIYVSSHNAPTIEGEGDRPFLKYWSVRQTSRQSGTISVSEHFKKWQQLGMSLGTIYETMFLVEGYNSQGTATVSRNSIVIAQPPIGE